MRVAVHGKPFTTNLLEFIRAAYGSNQSDDTNSLFCSQLIAKAYKEMGSYASGELVSSARRTSPRKSTRIMTRNGRWVWVARCVA